MFQSRKKLFVSLVAVLVLAGALIGGFFIQKDSSDSDIRGDATSQEVTQNNLTAVNISFSDTESISLESSFNEGETVFDLLKRLDNEKQDFSFSYKEYEGLGASPEKFNDYEIDPNSEWWKFLVNGQMSNVGISSYEIKPEDKIEFVREKF